MNKLDQMSKLDTVKIARKFDSLTADQKQQLFDKYGQRIVEDEVARCNLMDDLVSDSLPADFDAQRIVDLFSSKETFGNMSEILTDIYNM